MSLYDRILFTNILNQTTEIMTLIIDLAYNLTMLIAFAIVSGLVEKRIPGTTTKGMIIQGVLFGTVAVIGILNPFVLREGIFFDGRTIVISISTLFFGPITGLIAAIMAIISRIYIGGSGVVMGVATVIQALAVGYVFRHFWNRESVPGLTFLYYMGLVVHIIMVGMMLMLPSNLQRDVFESIAFTIIVFYPLTTVLMGKVLSDQLEIRHLFTNLSSSEAKFREIFNSVNESIFIHDAETGMIVDFNDRTLDLYKLNSREAVLNNFVRNLSAGDGTYNPESGMAHLKKAVAEGSHRFDWLARRPNDELFWVDVSLRYVTINDRGYVLAVVRDIDERKRKETETKENLREKEVLLAEVHHRVKNNLAIISSLLSLQLDSVTDPDAKELLIQTEKRIRSISLVHELVYGTEDLESIDFGSFLHRLIPIIDTFSGSEGCIVDVEVDAGHLEIDLNKSVPCALIVTELLTNSYKHAFKGMSTGKIYIKLFEQDDGYCLTIGDNGLGVDNVDRLQSGSSFGYTIITGLVNQIGGKMSFRNLDPGLEVTITFSNNRHK